MINNAFKILLLENISNTAVESFKNFGFENIHQEKGSLDENALIEALKDVEILGIRSKTHISKKILDNAPNLLAIGCFCIGTNQVDLEYAKQKGVAVFNAPFSNTRSVAELVIGQMIMLLRRIIPKNNDCHKGIWDKSATASYELRGKKLGIVGYGKIGTQVGILGEHFGMEVLYYDIESKLPIGNAKQIKDLADIASQVNILTLHVPETQSTDNLISSSIINKMQKGSYLINASRGNVVDLHALEKAIKAQHILGAAIDVFPIEPSNNQEKFICNLQNISNVILTPHIGGSTHEAQENIGIEVADKLSQYILNGSSVSAMNIPELLIENQNSNHTRIVNIHKNVPGMLYKINNILAKCEINIIMQNLKSNQDVSYLVLDIAGNAMNELILKEINSIENVIFSRIL